MHSIIWTLFRALALGAAAASALALLAERSWLAELAVHFRVQYFAIGLLATLALAIRRSVSLAVAAILLVTLNVGPVVSLFSAAPPTTVAGGTGTAVAAVAQEADTRPGAGGAAGKATASVAGAAVPATGAGVPLKIASANVLFLNDAHAEVLAWARRTRPDVLLFLEATAEWRRALAPLEAEYPHSRYVTDLSHHGLLLLSRWRLDDVVTEPPGGRLARPVIFATLTRDGASLRLAAMHATWPLRPFEARERARDLAALAAEAARRGPLPFIAVGDLNISPFSPYYAATLRAGGLRSAAAGRGWQPTWPSVFLPLGIQIDHALVSPDVQVTAFHRGPPNGSDHLPIIVDVIIPRNQTGLVHP